ncbi:MAG: MBL fold metallo-hydrolase [Acidobacteria bacterium]|nr:MBL fold metallo-hydrolase [Acidobacteriota bacterium]
MRALFALLVLAASMSAAKTLDVYFIDVEGGQATLVVAPSGESMLTDAGWPGFNGRDSGRIAAAAKAAGIQQIDYFVASHYHLDHVGGAGELAAKVPIRAFVDHGPTVESGADADKLFGVYRAARDKGRHLRVKPGDTIPLKGLNVQVVAAGGEKIARSLKGPGAGAANGLCASTPMKEEDKGENARSVGTLVSFGDFRMINLGDLTWNKERDLVCPSNPIGAVDVYLTTHHGLDSSGPRAIVHALRPRVVVMNNGARKGGTAEALQVIRSSPGLEDVWQLHYSLNAGKDLNAADTFIANTDESCSGQWLKLSVSPDGSFTLTNSRNRYSKQYKPRS